MGALLVDGDAVPRIAGFREPDDCYRERNRWCYEACIDLCQRREALDQISVAHELERTGKLADVGGTAYLGHLVEILPTSVHVEYYGRIVQRTSTMRRLIRAASDI